MVVIYRDSSPVRGQSPTINLTAIQPAVKPGHFVLHHQTTYYHSTVTTPRPKTKKKTSQTLQLLLLLLLVTCEAHSKLLV